VGDPARPDQPAVGLFLPVFFLPVFFLLVFFFAMSVPFPGGGF
jgi:hypothetical protein